MLQLGWVTLNNILTRQILNEGNFNPTLKAEVPIEKFNEIAKLLNLENQSKIHIGNGDVNTGKYSDLYDILYIEASF